MSEEKWGREGRAPLKSGVKEERRFVTKLSNPQIDLNQRSLKTSQRFV